MEKMKFGVIVSERKAEVREHEVFSIKEHEVLIKNKACNLCTSDYQQWSGLRPHQPVPTAFGHESSGVIAKLGNEVENLKVGDHVVANIYQPCLECWNCRQGKNSKYCKNYLGWRKDKYGYYGLYGCGEYQVFKSKHIFKVSKDLPFENAGFSEPLATVVSGLQKIRIEHEQKVLVIGAGTMGVLNSLAARYYGADVIISEISTKKLKTVKEMGFNKLINITKDNYAEKIKEYTNWRGLDVIIIAVGVTQAYNQALEIASLGCKLLIFASGYPAPKWNLDPNTVHYKLLEIIGTCGCSSADYQKAIDLLSENKIDVTPLIEEKYPLEDMQRAFEKATTPDTYRTSIVL